MPRFPLQSLALTATARDEEGAHRLEQGALLLSQWRGNSFAEFTAAAVGDDDDERCASCPVAFATMQQVLATIGRAITAEQVASMLRQDTDERAPWERRYLKGCVAFVTARYLEAFDFAAQSLLAIPTDVFSMRLAIISWFFHPRELTQRLHLLCKELSCKLDASHTESMEAARAFVYSICAFAEQENDGDLARALELVEVSRSSAEAFNAFASGNERYAIAQPFTVPYAFHALCHVFERRRDPQAGLKAATAFPDQLWKPSVHLRTHNDWHVALFYHSLGDVSRTWQEYDQTLSGVASDDPFQLCDATALLMRCWVSSRCVPRNPTPSDSTSLATWWPMPKAGDAMRSLMQKWSALPGDRLQLFFVAHWLSCIAMWRLSCLDDPSQATYLAPPPLLLRSYATADERLQLLTGCVRRLTPWKSELFHNVIDDGRQGALNRDPDDEVSWIEMGGSAAQRSIFPKMLLCLTSIQ